MMVSFFWEKETVTLPLWNSVGRLNLNRMKSSLGIMGSRLRVKAIGSHKKDTLRHYLEIEMGSVL
jgi:hypothetical protein